MRRRSRWRATTIPRIARCFRAGAIPASCESAGARRRKETDPMPIVKGGRGNYGEAVGILTLDTVFPRIPGDVGNATTFHFPVRLPVGPGPSPRRVVHQQDAALLQP